MAIFFLFMFVINILTCTKVRCVDQCKTHADCRISGYFSGYCCGGYLSFGSKDRSCTFSSCLNRYCSTDNDCGDPSMCCRSNRCVNKGCSGCKKNEDCYGSQVCCKNTFPRNQTVCASSCVNLACNSNNDCAGWRECCRAGQCTQKGCSDLCKSNSECDFGQYCCLRKRQHYYHFWPNDGCSADCLGKICSTSDDCGAHSVCCISNKCVDRGCSRCSSNADCYSGQYCCKKRHWYELSECSADCIGKSCNTSESCGGPSEICNANDRCEIRVNVTSSQYAPYPTKTVTSSTSSSLPPWQIAVVTISLVVFVVSVAQLTAVFWYLKRKRLLNSNDAANSETLQNRRYGIPNRQTNAAFGNLHDPSPQNRMQQLNANHLVYETHIPTGYSQGIYEVPGTRNQDPRIENPQLWNETQGFQMSPTYDDEHVELPLDSIHSNNEIFQPYQNLPQNHLYQTVERPTIATQFQENGNPQHYPQNPPPYYSQFESK